MPFSRDYYFKRFTAVELHQLQSAYLMACKLVGRCSVTTPHKDEMAREIIQIYECGVTGPEKIAQLMLKVESVKPKKVVDPEFQQGFIRPVKANDL